eukprot:TRINITY_DN401_c0_g1_i1.p1 TRINITY_DN401_c0_g1~~TRINITY_DN401_c0_g1_i1.p1  ORF type:complete len:378 (-),score=110.53 TRINITY_DN401_c0_g1_i1:380-1384(-)
MEREDAYLGQFTVPQHRAIFQKAQTEKDQKLISIPPALFYSEERLSQLPGLALNNEFIKSIKAMGPNEYQRILTALFIAKAKKEDGNEDFERYDDFDPEKVFDREEYGYVINLPDEACEFGPDFEENLLELLPPRVRQQLLAVKAKLSLFFETLTALNDVTDDVDTILGGITKEMFVRGYCLATQYSIPVANKLTMVPFVSLIPCTYEGENVVVTEEEDGSILVSAKGDGALGLIARECPFSPDFLPSVGFLPRSYQMIPHIDFSPVITLPLPEKDLKEEFLALNDTSLDFDIPYFSYSRQGVSSMDVALISARYVHTIAGLKKTHCSGTGGSS